MLFLVSLAVAIASPTRANGFQSATNNFWRRPSSRGSPVVGSPTTTRGGSVVKQNRIIQKRQMTGENAATMELPPKIVEKTVTADIAKRTQQSSQVAKDNRLDKILFCVYFCTCVGSSLPVILMPLIAAEQAALSAASFSSAAFCAQVASIAALGGAFGKLVNGFLCQAVGGRVLSSAYLIGITACTGLLSLAATGSTGVGWTLAGLEFFVSAQWPACSLVLANHFGHNPARFAQAITVLSLSSTAGALLGKLGGTALLPFVPSWRIAARCGALVTLVGSLLMYFFVSEYPADFRKLNSSSSLPSSGLGLKQIAASLRSVLGSPIFWLAGLAHSTTYLVRTSDRVLGALFHDTTALPKSICGLLTASVTLGLVHGISKASGFQKLPSTAARTNVLKRNYVKSVLFTLGLGLFSFQKFSGMIIPSKMLLAAIIALLSGGMASSLAFQFYQIPPQIASAFGENKAVCLSFLDAMGFFMSAFAWGITGKIVSSLGAYGWSTTFVLLGLLFGAGGALMSSVYPEIERSSAQAA